MDSKLRIIESHQQLYENSCPSMAVELVLKLHNQVPGSYRKIQDSYKNKNVGYGPFRNRWIRRLWFYEQGFDSPFAGLSNLLEKELSSARFPIMSLYSGEEIRNGKRYIFFHEWVVVQRSGNDFRATSKHFRQTIWTDVLPALQKGNHTNLLLYKLV